MKQKFKEKLLDWERREKYQVILKLLEPPFIREWNAYYFRLVSKEDKKKRKNKV
jgi:hypothetical protein